MAELEREGRPFAVATVVRTIGSTPQVVGAKMLVDDLGRTYGTLGGGCVEGDAFAEAKRILDEGGSSLREYELTEELAWDTGLVCGGTMWIHIESGAGALTVGGRDLLADVLAASSTGTPIGLATLLHKAGRELVPAGRLYVEQSGASGGSLVVVGAGHVGLALATLARGLDYDVTVIDDRPEFASQERFPKGVEVVRADMVEALGTLSIGWNAFIVVATRGHKLDAQCLRAAIGTRARYVGLLGSKRKTILIERMLRDEGLPEERIRSVHAPVGLDLGGRTPAEIALSVVAELSMERYGGNGRPLRLGDDIYERAVSRPR
jgi:xanthine dehydrogenase accessory factor